MGMLSGLFGGGGASKRAAQAAAQKEAAAADLSRQQFEASQKAISGQSAAGQEAIRQQQAAADAAVRQRYAEAQGYYQPYQQAGTAALGSYQGIAATLPEYTSRINTYAQSMDPIMAQITSKNLNDYQESPGYDFRFKQGQRALEASRSASGLRSAEGATGKALLRYGQDIGSQEYDSYLDRLYRQLGGVQSQIGGVQSGQQSAQGSLDAYGNLINVGQGATNAITGMGSNMEQFLAQQGAGATQFGANYGMEAERLKADLGRASASEQGQRLANMGSLYAQGMLEKDRQMKAAGDQWLNLGTAALTGGASAMMPGGGPFNTSGQQQGGRASIQPYFGNQTAGTNYLSRGVSAIGDYFTPQQQAAPWVNPDSMTYGPQMPNNAQTQAKLGSQSVYKQRRYA
jgi:hypothetical protein